MTADIYDKKTSLPRPLRVMMVCAEMTPFSRSGGLGDVMLALPRALGNMGLDVTVVTPHYVSQASSHLPNLTAWSRPLWTSIGGQMRDVGVLETSIADGVRVMLLESPPLFARNGIYGDEHGDWPDNDVRFAVLGASALRIADTLWNGPPDVLHAHDWHGALSVVYARGSTDDAWRAAPSVLTIHNLAFQGVFGLERARNLDLPEQVLNGEAMRHGDQLNFLKGAITYADRVTTVSPTYAREATSPQYGCGLEHALLSRSNSLVGIVNGIDIEVWDPARDRNLAARFDAHDQTARAACKMALGAELGLDVSADGLLIGVVSRLAYQKGIDMLIDILEPLVQMGMRIAVVAQGEPELEDRMRQAAAQWPSRVAFRRAFGDPISRRVYAGADLFVMPSRFEPCGLGQQCAMRYGAIPVVSARGGLADTVQQFDETTLNGTGFLFSDVSPEGLLEALKRAARVWERQPAWTRLVRNAMMRDASWDVSARKYFALYRDLVGAPPRDSLPPPPPVHPKEQEE